MESWDLWLSLGSFYLILAASLIKDRKSFQFIRSRSIQEWFLDLQGLFIQGWLVPLAKTYGLIFLLFKFAPSLEKSLELSSIFSFFLAFALVDYAYYWNHRILHRSTLWHFHRVHHSAKQLDIFTTARNSLWTPLLIVYLWIHTFFVYILADPFPYILGATLTAILDLWRHSPALGLRHVKGLSHLNRILITPDEHAWHHSVQGMNTNFGANFSLWDRIHGTYQDKHPEKMKIGWSESRSVLQQWLTPWTSK